MLIFSAYEPHVLLADDRVVVTSLRSFCSTRDLIQGMIRPVNSRSASWPRRHDCLVSPITPPAWHILETPLSEPRSAWLS